MPVPLSRLPELFTTRDSMTCAPMAFAVELAAAVSRTGGLGPISGGYGDPDWLEKQFEIVRGTPVGVGFIIGSLKKEARLAAGGIAYEQALAAALMLGAEGVPLGTKCLVPPGDGVVVL
ncbi:beta/alpha barrel domain-containing protein [Flexibacterium corallicola]|uniref:hypothetical protein n=1 Tax=Flexibacterium corallicola TaxID=3037259 RepID=UPI00286F3213|nr:hypothetical protein [Pseudovibrio sp. M1P-2-3]